MAVKDARCLGTGATRRNSEITLPAEGQPSSLTVAITVQEGIDGYREKAMRIASVVQVEVGSFVELSVSGHVLKWARQSKLSGGAALSVANGWNLTKRC